MGKSGKRARASAHAKAKLHSSSPSHKREIFSPEKPQNSQQHLTAPLVSGPLACMDAAYWWAVYAGVLLPVRFLFCVICPPMLHYYWHNGSPHHLAQDGYPVYEGVELVAKDLPYGRHPRETLDVLAPSKPTESLRYGNDCSTWFKVLEAATASIPDLILAYPRALLAFAKKHVFTGPDCARERELAAVRGRRAVLFIHGGGFVAVDPSIQHHQLTCFVRAGYVVYAMAYPWAPEAPYPTALVSTLQALAWLKRVQEVDHVLLVGESAGGNLATMAAGLIHNPSALASFAEIARSVYGATHERLAPAALYPRVAGVASWYGVLDGESWKGQGFLSWGLEWTQRTYVGRSPYPLSLTNLPPGSTREDLRRREACDFLDLTRALQRGRFAAYPPLLIVSGTADPLGLAHSARVCFKEMKRRVPSCRVSLVEYDAGHAFIGLNPFVLWALQGSFKWREYALPATMDTLKFCREYL